MSDLSVGFQLADAAEGSENQLIAGLSDDSVSTQTNQVLAIQSKKDQVELGLFTNAKNQANTNLQTIGQAVLR